MNRFTLSRRPHTRKRRTTVRLELELLEGRDLLSGLTLGPLVQVTGPSPFPPQPGYYRSAEVEPYLAVNPTNPKNMVGVWTQDMLTGGGGGQGIGVAVTFNGGNTWKTGVMPGLTLASGGTYQAAADSWLSFAPNGDLYFTCISANAPVSFYPSPSAILFEKSTDGGRTWSAPITLIQSTDPKVLNDKDSITADPTAGGYAYAVWAHLTHGWGQNPVMFARTTNGGQSWDTPSTIFDPGGGKYAPESQVVVLPDGTLTDFFDVVSNGSQPMALSLIQSSDKGQTWLPPIQLGNMRPIGVTDPDTGQPVDAPPWLMFDVAVDPHNGNLYAVWEDARFSNSQYDSIAFSMSTDKGFTWSAPIQINQTPTNIPTGDQQAFLPSIAVAADGTVGVTYYDFRFNDPNPGLRTDYWLVEGPAETVLTNPANWHNEAHLTQASFDMEKAAVWSANARGFFLGDYQGFAAAGNSFNAFFSATNGTDPGDIYFRDPVAAASAPVPVLMNEATAATDPGALLSSETSVMSLAVDAYFMNLARTSQTTNGADDSAFTTPRNQREQMRMDLLTALEQDLGHVLGREHEESGVMIDILPPGTRRTTASDANLSDFPDADWLPASTELESVGHRKTRQ